MAYIQYLNFDGEDLPLPISYDIGLSDIEADSSVPASCDAGLCSLAMEPVGTLVSSIADANVMLRTFLSCLIFISLSSS